MTPPLRVLHAPSAVGGHPPALARAERELGLESECVLLEGRGAARELLRWRLLRRALREADVVHFNFGSSVLPRWWPSAHRGLRAPYGVYARLVELRDLDWLRRAGKAVFVTYQGDDVRTEASVRARLGAAAAWASGYYDSRDDERKRRAALRVQARAHGVFALNPDLVRLVPAARFLPYASVDVRDYRLAPLPRNRRPVVVHAPTDRRNKGTAHVVAAVDRLRAGGLDVQLRLVEQRPRQDVRRALEAADVYVDQVLLGWYGGTAVEAMALGRPTIAYIHEPDLEHVPSPLREELPVVSATPATLTAAIREALERGTELAARSRAFVERWHDPLRVAATTKAAYEEAVARITRR